MPLRPRNGNPVIMRMMLLSKMGSCTAEIGRSCHVCVRDMKGKVIGNREPDAKVSAHVINRVFKGCFRNTLYVTGGSKTEIVFSHKKGGD